MLSLGLLTWMDLDGFGWTWMDLDGLEWTWMDLKPLVGIQAFLHPGFGELPANLLVSQVASAHLGEIIPCVLVKTCRYVDMRMCGN